MKSPEPIIPIGSVNVRQETALVMHRNRDDRILQLLLNLRVLDPKGSGSIPYSRIEELDFASDRSIRGYISKGMELDLLWKTGTKKNGPILRYIAQPKLYLRAVGLQRPSGHYFSFDPRVHNDLTLQELRAFFYVIGVFGDKQLGYSNPIARGKQSDRHGLKRRSGRVRKTQRTYEKSYGRRCSKEPRSDNGIYAGGTAATNRTIRFG